MANAKESAAVELLRVIAETQLWLMDMESATNARLRRITELTLELVDRFDLEVPSDLKIYVL